ncbi:dolichol-phosphate mannosyltransferase [Marivirga lumbricoides]|uniref:Dolichol-phosphate mannosyltransferase n=1 Tax=Marivirga lumbricoides TaxID=1046115 RepID=A0A2T4DVH2_9BACT|nr:dolichyl-phosphate beta-D-mannosyltransferase [Marivirga lumbricoides]GGC28818.1 dolichol-phosphate mannosyltransferase [Marivirga lumbricoides]
MNDSLVIIPTYNERENIEDILRAIFLLTKKFDVLIIDDNSPDGTAEIVKELQKDYPENLHLLERLGKMGLGTAYITGFRYALERNYQYIFEMDADFSHNPLDLLELYKACKSNEDVQLVIGSRYVTGVNVVNWPMGRVLMSYFASKYVKFVTGLPVYDATAGFICYHRSVLETLDLDKIRFIGYAFQIEMKFLTWKYGFGIKEVPIIFTDRSKGESKMSQRIFREAIFGVIQMKLYSLFKKYKRNAS